MVRTDGEPALSSSSNPRLFLVLELVGTIVPSIYCNWSSTRAGRRISIPGTCSSIGNFRFPNVVGSAAGIGATSRPVELVILLVPGTEAGLEVLRVVASSLECEVGAEGAAGGRGSVLGPCELSLLAITWDGSGD